MNRKTILLSGSLVVLLFLGWWLTQSFTQSRSPSLPSPVPALETAEGETKQSQNAAYVDYSERLFEEAKHKKRVYFFHAKWCPTCKAANEAFLQNISAIPDDVILFKTDYDTEAALKQKYAITYQHTFVQVDEKGNAIAKWNGGDIDLLKANLK